MRMNNTLCQTEEENHSTELLMKSENRHVLGPDGSMHEIKTDSIGREWIDIGGEKKWFRKCSTCDNLVFYTERNNCLTAERKKKICKECQDIKATRVPIIDSFVRQCPKCGRDIHYGAKNLRVRTHNFCRATRNNTMCSKCTRGGENNGAYGLHRFGKDNPNYGTKWTDKQRDNARKYWSEKFAERGYTFNNHNPIACEYFDQLSKERGWKLQHARNGGEHIVIGYFLDAYDATNNIVVEYDEPHHFVGRKLRQEDVDRMTKIKHTIGCRFFRYDEPKKELREY